MTAYSSSTLNLLDRHCPRALDFAKAGTFRITDIFQPGIAAHAVLQAIGEAGADADRAAVAEGVVRQLVTVGRAFNYTPEPPMSPQAATTGRDIALAYLARRELEADAKYEIGLAVDNNWEPVEYAATGSYYRAAIDRLQIIESESDDGYPIIQVITTDWKSAWSTDAGEVDTVQMRGQAALAWAHYPQATVLIRRAVNLRTGAQFDAETVMDEDGARVVAGWRADIGHSIAAAEARQADGQRPARPGMGCLTCPYLSVCRESIPVAHDTPEQLAMEWMLYKAHVDMLTPKLKALCDEGPIDSGNGKVGFHAKTKREATEDAPRAIANEWFLGTATDTEVGLLTALKLSAANIESISKALHPFDKTVANWKEQRASLVAACLRDKPVSEFGAIE